MLFECCRCFYKFKKNKVVHHVYTCTGVNFRGEKEDDDDVTTVRLSCLGCGVKLIGNEYLTHVDSGPKSDVSSSKHGIDQAQQRKVKTPELLRSAWGQSLRKALVSSSLSPAMKKLLEDSNLEMSPRKLPKFKKYLRRCSAEVLNNQSVESDVLSVFMEALKDFKEQFSSVVKPSTEAIEKGKLEGRHAASKIIDSSSVPIVKKNRQKRNRKRRPVVSSDDHDNNFKRIKLKSDATNSPKLPVFRNDI